MKNFKTVLSIVFMVSSINYGFSQKKLDLLTDSEKAETIKEVGGIINRNYIFPEISNKITILLNDKLKDGKYTTVKDPLEFANVLTKDIQSFNHDKHLRVLFEPKRIANTDLVISDEDSIVFAQNYLKSLKKNNYFFKQVKILEGNIGYLEFTRFISPEHAAETVISAMNILSNTEALIIDLRKNGGGSPEMVQLISSYFFENEPVHLNSIYNRRNKQDRQYWTLPFVPGKKNSKVQLYILTSKRTFSAAEEFAYNLKNLNRAILIGENTAGGAHSGGRIKATKNYNVWTPMGRAINPITGTNWEGVGVKPHININAEEALLEAHIKALDSLKSVSINEKSESYYKWHLETIKAKKSPQNISMLTLNTYTGNYGIHTVSLENDFLHIQRNNSIKDKLIPLNQDTFMLEESSDVRFQFLVKKNKIATLRIINIDGTSSEHKIN